MLAAAELAYAAAASAEGPVRFEPVEVGEGEEPMFRPVAFAPVGGLEGEWQGVPLQVLASVLDRSRTPQSADDEEYAASFVYVLFRLKAALGVWRGDGAPSARYRLWLKDMAAVIARHPRTGPKVVDCYYRLLRALAMEAETLNAAFDADQKMKETLFFQLFAPLADQVIRMVGEDLGTFEDMHGCLWRCSDAAERRQSLRWALQVRGCLIRWQGHQVRVAAKGRRCGHLAGAYINRGSARQDAAAYGPSSAIRDFDRAIAIQEDLRRTLQPSGDWPPQLRESLAAAYMNRGASRARAAGHGPLSAIEDFDRAIAIQGDLRRTLEASGRWGPQIRESMAMVYMNRGNARLVAAGHGPASAIEDFDRAIALREDLRRTLVATGDWNPTLRETLANAYMNRGTARQVAAGYGPSSAIEDYDRAIAIQEDLRRKLEPSGHWDPPLRDSLATTYMNRGNARAHATGHGPLAAIEDYHVAIAIQEELRQTLVAADSWHPPLRESLASAYTGRGVAKVSAAGHGPSSAIEDFDRAIAIQEDLRRALEPSGGWDPPLRESLATAYMNRGNAKAYATGHGPSSAIEDFDQVIAIREELRCTLEPFGRWDPLLRESLAKAHLNRGNARLDAAGHGPASAIQDFERAITIREDLRRTLEPSDRWDPPLRESMANAYMNRGNARLSAAGHGPSSAIEDYDRAIIVREDLRRTLEPSGGWYPPLRETLAIALFNRSLAREALGAIDPAMGDAIAARDIVADMIESVGEQACPPMWIGIRDAAESQIADLRSAR